MPNKDEILRRTNSGLDVFKHYIPGQWRVGRNFLNPLYEDRRASCNIYYDRRNGCYRLKDFGNDDFSGDCFDIVGKIKGLDCGNPIDFIGILEIIDRELNLGLGDNGGTPFNTPASPKPLKTIEARSGQTEATEQPGIPEKAKPYSVGQQLFSVKELSFWGQYGISPETLKAYRVFSLKEFKSENGDGKPFSLYSSETEPMFAYQGRRHVKIYRPFSGIRFLYGGMLPDNYCFGLEQLPAKGDTLFITGGEKDVLSLVSKGFHAICFNSETSNIPQGIIRKMSYRFKHIILLYDTDKTGLDSSARHVRQLSDMGVKRLVLPLPGTKQEKDISDFFRLGNTRENFIRLFIDFLDNLYSETMAILKPCEIDFNNPPVKSEAVISINDVPLGTQGNLLGITGGEGTGKSNYAGSLIAGIFNIETAMFIDRKQFEEWMRRIMERLDQLEKKMDKPDKPRYEFNGEKLLDNTDLCFMLNCSKRTLQRFRVSGLLPHKRISQKTYYLESDVLTFIREHLKKPSGKRGK